MTSRFVLPALVLVSLAALATALASPRGGAPAGAKDVRVELSRKFPGSKPADFRPSQVAGIYEYAQGADIIYVSADGKHAFVGDLFDVAKETNLSEARRREARRQLMQAVPESQMLVFSPKQPRHTVTVFTDIDCGYCRKLHGEIAKYNELGIRVRYLFYPRTGPDTESWDKAVAVWCSPNRNDSLTRAKRGETIRAARCSDAPVARDFELGQEMGLQGTPAIVLASGEMLPGYVPPAMLARRLEAEGL